MGKNCAVEATISPVIFGKLNEYAPFPRTAEVLYTRVGEVLEKLQVVNLGDSRRCKGHTLKETWPEAFDALGIN